MRTLGLFVQRSSAATLAATTVVLVTLALGASVTVVESRLMAPGIGTVDWFGYRVAIDGPVAVVGAPLDDDSDYDAGAAYVFEKVGGAWVFTQKLVLPTGYENDRFGWAVAASGDRIAVSAFKEDAVGFDSGAVYVYRETAGTWQLEQQLLASDLAANDRFGWDVSLAGDLALISSDSRMKVYVFRWNGSSWHEEALLEPAGGPVGGGNNNFGWSLAIQGDTALIGARLDSESASHGGAAYVFQRTNGEWQQTQKVWGTDTFNNDGFGYSVSLDGDLFAVGAPQDLNQPTGKAYVFERGEDGWHEVARLVRDTGALEQFGFSISLVGEALLVGAPDWIPSNTGAAYLFRQQGAGWELETTLSPSDGQSNRDFFGYSVAMTAGSALVGAYKFDPPAIGRDAGAAYAFDLPDPSPAARIDRLETRIDGLVASGILLARDARPLSAKLSGAARDLDKGNVFAAQGKLQAFSNSVAALQKSGRLADDIAAQLVGEAQAIWDQLNDQ